MHLVYDTRTGDVIDGPVTGGGWGPAGIPDDRALVNVPESDRPHAAVLRMDDSEAGPVMALATTNALTVVDGEVVAGDPLDLPEPEPPAPDPMEVMQGQLDQLAWDLLLLQLGA